MMLRCFYVGFLTNMLLAFIGIFGDASTAAAACQSSTKGIVDFAVLSCKVVQPEADIAEDVYRNLLATRTSDELKALQKDYKGLLVYGKVVNSSAVRNGKNPSKHALKGEAISLFMHEGESTCADFLAKEVNLDIKETCCDGSHQAPCLLQTSYTIVGVAKTPVNKSKPKAKSAAKPKK